MFPEGVSSEILALQKAWSESGPGPMAWLREAQRRIAALDSAGSMLNAVLEWNPAAEGEAAALERECAVSGRRGPLHGIPVLVKDNIDTAGSTHTSAGTLALGDRFASRDAFIAARLRAAGAVLCGKANMTELANFMTENMPNGYSSRGGQVRHAWKDGADASGSSTGAAVAVAAGYVPLAIGTETCGSIISPCAANGVVGLKPTVGWLSRTGIIPIAPSQDTAGPIARTVADCALALQAMAGFDPNDTATGLARGYEMPGVERCLPRPEGLRGFRFGLYPMDGDDKPIRQEAFFAAVDALKTLGAEVLPFSPPPRPMLTQDYFDARQVARAALKELYRLFEEQRLDAVISMAGLVAFPVTGCPALTLPVGWDAAEGLPVPMTFNGLPFHEGKLLAAASALERALGSVLPAYCRSC